MDEITPEPLRAGDEAWLTVPTRDAAGFSKHKVPQLTIPVTIVSIRGSTARVRPVGGHGEAGVALERLRPIEFEPIG
jgi:hypothetical protein